MIELLEAVSTATLITYGFLATIVAITTIAIVTYVVLQHTHNN
jgi:hypothetical protein